MTSIGVFAAIFDEQGRILCVKRNYPPFNWTTPGGGMDEGESLTQAVEREVREETGYIVQAKRLLGAYSSTYKDDLVLSIEAEIVDRDEWQPNQEISEIGFFLTTQHQKGSSLENKLGGHTWHAAALL